MPNYTYYITEEAWKSFSNAMKTLKAEVNKLGKSYCIEGPYEEDLTTCRNKSGMLNLIVLQKFWEKIMEKAELEEVSKQGKIFIVKKEEKEWYENNDCQSCENNEGTELLIKKLERFR